MNLQNKTVLITGGGSGIGLALANAFAELTDNRIIICGRDRRKLIDAAGSRPNVDAVVCDTTRAGDVDNLLSHIKQNYGKLDILVNNAGIQNAFDFLNNTISMSKLEYELDVNFTSHVNVSLKCLPLLSGGHDAAIINITSALAIVPKKSSPMYNASKAALRLFTKTLRYQLEESNIKVFEVIPALVDTAMTQGRGKGKISPECLASDVLRNMEKDKFEIRIEKVRWLLYLHRIMPSFVEAVLKNN